MSKVKVANVNDLPEGGLKKVEVNGEPVALYKIDGKFYATQNECSHVGCGLDEHHSITGDVVECTCHGSQFNVKNGEVVLPPATEPLKTYQVSVEGEDVFISD
ncbi:hypothetical protein A3F02_00535 [Candidatus Curtissbacteria bacterium RIFCSPHIGHO2_12_FULL_38_9b]|uniref:Rieske domain-containing protein n=1 Tax=Candidatus Curtissbacteria bacterium RIFCSPHIGHO2_12_FULL_38_9b TaxID=1797720 RepID=A0A1F5GYS6_9BACT|nr:MAG: hypothetical protein A3F02_00535 [Candidatus Curtissbacteria bacterium RIFCSPHIGHO2_12_FULL_38_9b]